MKYGIATMKPNIDEKIASRMNVRSRFNSAYYMFDELETNLRKIETFANEAMDRYERAENNVQKQAEALAALFSMGIGTGGTINTIVNYVETQISEYNKSFFDIDELSDENDKVEDNESYWHKAVDLGEEGLDKAKEAFESVADKVEDKVEEIVQEVETEVKDALSAFEGKIENIEDEIDKTFTNKDVEDIALKTGEFITVLGREWNSTDSNELKELPQLQEEFEANIKSDASDLWKLYSKNNPDGAKTITDAIEDVAIAKKDLELGWQEYKQEDPIHAGMIAGTYDFGKGLIMGTFNLVHGAGVQYYDLREDPEGTLMNWARFAMDVAPLANPGIPETEDDKILVASMEEDVEDNLINGDTYTRTRFVTDAALNVATFFDGAGEASVVGKVGEAASDAGKITGISTAAEDLSKISSEANVAGNSIEGVSGVGKDISDVTVSGIGKDTSNLGMANEQIVQANASGETISRFSENKFELGNKGVDNINKPMVASDIAVKSSEVVTPKIDEVLVGSLAVKVALDEANIERAANIIDKTSEAEEVRKVVGAGDEAEIETSVNLFKKSGGGAEVGGKSVDEAEIGSGKVNDGKVDEGVSNASNINKYSLSGEEHYQALKDIFGEGNVEWTSKTTISQSERLKTSNWDFTPSDQLYLKYKDVYNNELYFDQATGKTLYPIDDGFLNGKYDFSKLKVGDEIDRFGSNGSGKFFAPNGSSYGSRALPPFMSEQPYTSYKVIKEFDVKSGAIAPWFGERGLGTQYFSDTKILDFYGNEVDATVENLLKYGYIEKITH
jgi:predicted small secreted protein